MSENRSHHILAINWQDITNPLHGGAEVHFHEIFKRIVAYGHRVTLLCSRYQNSLKSETIEGIDIVRGGNRSLFNYYVPYLYKNLIKKEQFDLIVDDLNKIPFFTPLFVKEPVLAILHHFFGKSIFLETSFLSANYVYWSEKMVPLIYKRIPFAVVSESARQELLSAGITAPIELLQNGVNQAIFKKKSNAKFTTPTIGYLGRLKKYKSIDHLLRAMPIIKDVIPDIKLLIIGEGDHKKELQKVSKDLEIEGAVDFVGRVSEDEKVTLLNKLWCTVNPSPKEGWGLTVIEANACGVPTIAADSPGLRDSVMDDQTGILYPYGDIAQLAQHIIRILQDSDRLNRYSIAAEEWAGKFTWEQSAVKALELIDQALRIGDKYAE